MGSNIPMDTFRKEPMQSIRSVQLWITKTCPTTNDQILVRSRKGRRAVSQPLLCKWRGRAQIRSVIHNTTCLYVDQLFTYSFFSFYICKHDGVLYIWFSLIKNKVRQPSAFTFYLLLCIYMACYTFNKLFSFC